MGGFIIGIFRENVFDNAKLDYICIIVLPQMSMKPRIAFLHDEFPKGGGEQVTVNLVPCLEKEGYEIFVFAHRVDKEKLPQAVENVGYLMLPYGANDRRNLPFVCEAIRVNAISVFISAGFMLPYFGEVREATGCRTVFVSHNPPFWETVFKRENGLHRASGSFGKWLEWYLLRAWKFSTGVFARSLRKKYRALYDSVDLFGVLCDSYGRIIADGIGVEYAGSKFRVFTNPLLPAADIQCRREMKVVFVGRLTYADKRVDRLLRIWAGVEPVFPGWSLDIVGDGPEVDSLKSLSLKLGLQRVAFRGYAKDVSTFYGSSEILCLTSTFEGWPMVLIEAQNYGCVPIAFDCSAGVSEILLPDGVNGILVKPFDEDAYAARLSELMSDDALRERIRKSAAENLSRFSIDITVGQWKTALDNLINR